MKRTLSRMRCGALLAALGAGPALLPAWAADPDMTRDAQPASQSQYQSPAGPTGATEPAPSGTAGAQGMDAQGDLQRTPGTMSPGMMAPRERERMQPMHDMRGGRWSGRDAAMTGSMAGEGLTREEVQAETRMWRESGLLRLLEQEDSSVMMRPEVMRLQQEVSAAVESERQMARGNRDTRDAGGMGMGGSDSPMQGQPGQQPMPGGVQLGREPAGPEVNLPDDAARRAMQPPQDPYGAPATVPGPAPGQGLPEDRPPAPMPGGSPEQPR